MVKVFLHPDEVSKKRFLNRRAYPRFPYVAPVSFHVCTKHKIYEKQDIFAENISQTGMCLLSPVAPPLSSLILMATDNAALERCLMLEEIIVTEDKSLLAKVVQVRHDPVKALYVVGITFIKKKDIKRDDMQQVLGRIPGLR
jgi:c-di-GMP-binding flagellar brake protein YcgR